MMKKLFIVLLILLSHVQLKAAESYAFSVRIVGKGKPMILIPGIKSSADQFNEIITHYKGHFKCYVITLAGFAGQPPMQLSDHLLRDQRDQIIQYMLDRHLKKPILTGFSFGGLLALWIATTRPDLVGPVIDLDGPAAYQALEHPSLNRDSLVKDHTDWYNKIVSHPLSFYTKQDSTIHAPARHRMAINYMKAMITDTSRILQVLAWDQASDYRTTAEMTRESDTLDLRNDLAKINSPILLLGSWQSWNVYKTKEAALSRYQDEFSKARHIDIAFSDHGKHFLMYEDYDWMIGEMDAFLKKYN
jgi:N-formylmaleamate deformylase